MQDPLDNVKPMSEDDYANLQKKLATVNPSELNTIYNDYGGKINKLIMLAMKQTKDESEIVELESLKRIVNLAPADERFLRSKDKIWAARTFIIEKNEKYFMEKNYGKLIKKDRNQAMLETIMSIAKNGFKSLKPEEKEMYWTIGYELLHTVAKFKKLVGEH